MIKQDAEKIYWRTDSTTLMQHAVPGPFAMSEWCFHPRALCGFQSRFGWYCFNMANAPTCKDCEEMMTKPEQANKQNQ